MFVFVCLFVCFTIIIIIIIIIIKVKLDLLLIISVYKTQQRVLLRGTVLCLSHYKQNKTICKTESEVLLYNLPPPFIQKRQTKHAYSVQKHESKIMQISGNIYVLYLLQAYLYV